MKKFSTILENVIHAAERFNRKRMENDTHRATIDPGSPDHIKHFIDARMHVVPEGGNMSKVELYNHYSRHMDDSGRGDKKMKITDFSAAVAPHIVMVKLGGQHKIINMIPREEH